MSSGYRSLNRRKIIKVLLAQGDLHVFSGAKHDLMKGSYRGKGIKPIQLPNTHGKGKQTYEHDSDKIKAIRDKLGLTKKEFYELVDRVLG